MVETLVDPLIFYAWWGRTVAPGIFWIDLLECCNCLLPCGFGGVGGKFCCIREFSAGCRTGGCKLKLLQSPTLEYLLKVMRWEQRYDIILYFFFVHFHQNLGKVCRGGVLGFRKVVVQYDTVGCFPDTGVLGWEWQLWGAKRKILSSRRSKRKREGKCRFVYHHFIGPGGGR